MSPWQVLNVSADLFVETTGTKRKVAEDSEESASNFPVTAGSSKVLFDPYWPTHSVPEDLSAETTGAKGKVAEDLKKSASSFPVTAG